MEQRRIFPHPESGLPCIGVWDEAFDKWSEGKSDDECQTTLRNLAGFLEFDDEESLAKLPFLLTFTEYVEKVKTGTAESVILMTRKSNPTVH